jgi:hypothetical protein
MGQHNVEKVDGAECNDFAEKKHFAVLAAETTQ